MSSLTDTIPPPPATLDSLTELALDLRWSYNHAADKLWEQLDAELWNSTHNPWIVLQTVSQERLQSVAADPGFQALVADLHGEKTAAVETKGWFQKAHPQSDLTGAIYFSMEYMLSEALPIYSGGLGNVAGDQLKASSNLGVPVTAIGLLYQQGYFRQEIDASGHQLALYPFNDPGQLPIRPARRPNGEWLRLAIDISGATLWLRAWEIRMGRSKLYLLDSNDPANTPAHRGITSELYGGGPELRLKQEIVLGIGGWRLVEALGLAPEVCHLNEGHAAFAVLERALSYMARNRQPFATALAVTRAGNLFTTHTPVAAGFDTFTPTLMQKYFKSYAAEHLKISLDDLLALGRRDPGDAGEPLNMAFLAIRGSGAVNGVSRLHGEVSRKIFQPLFERWPEVEVPVAHVTNGVHAPTWDSTESDALWEKACGKERWRGEMAGMDGDVRRVADVDLWALRNESRKTLVEYARTLLARQLTGRGAGAEEIAEAAQVLDPNALTLGFARRFATYKRPDLLLHDGQRLTRILSGKDRPVQLVLAGKAHPQDFAGQEIIRRWFEFIRNAGVKSRIVFLSDYDARMAEQLVRGVDVWINTPRRPWEASGTSGMKVLVNGGLNLSELDGWWAEAYSPDVGWALGDGREHGDDPGWDASEAETLYGLLEREVIPEFYARDSRGIPIAWVARMRESMARLTPMFSTNRVVRQYTEQYYMEGAKAFRRRAANRGLLGEEIAKWSDDLAKNWARVRFGGASVERDGLSLVFQAQAFLGAIEPGNVTVEIYAEGKNGGAPARAAMARGKAIGGAENAFEYSVRVPDDRAAGDYTPRIVPRHEAAKVPLEAPYILWYDRRNW